MPITITDMNSGYNIANWITFNPWFSDMLGITRTEFDLLVDQIYDDNKISFNKESLKSLCERYYNGYKFTRKGKAIFNPMMLLFMLDNIKNFDELPPLMADNNLRIDYSQIAYIFGNNVETRDEVIKSITDDKSWQHGFTLNISFDMNAYKEGKYIAEGLFYSGILTLGEYGDELIIPNLITYEFVLSYFNRIMNFKESSIIIGKILHPYSYKDNVEGMIEMFFIKVIQEYPIDFFKNANESFYHGLLFYVLCNQLYKNSYEVLPEYQVTNGQVDIMVRSLEGAKVRHKVNDLFEIKRVPKSATDTHFEAKFTEAKIEMKSYLTGKYVNWRGVAVCFRGNKDYKIEVFKNQT